MNITEIAIRRPSLIIVLFSVFALMGIIGYKNLSYELMPDFNQPVVVIKTVYPGAEPAAVETSVSLKIEDALSNLEGVDYLITKSLPNASVVIANMRYGTDLDKTMQDAQRYIENIRKDLPQDIFNPEMSKISPNDLPIMTVSATSNLPGTEFYQKMKDDYLPGIKQLKGVAEITVLGSEEREIQVRVDPDKLKLYRISLQQVVEAINLSGLDIPAGKVESPEESSTVRLTGKFTDIGDIAGVQIAMPIPGNPVYVRDVAIVSDGVKELTSVSRYNGKNGLGLLIKKQADANAVDVSRAIRKKFESIENDNQESEVRFVISEDTTDNTIDAVNSVVFDLFLAVFLVSAVMLLFLRSFRNSLIVAVAIPTSLVTAFGAMWLLGYTLNLMTLLAMSLVIGVLVDDATVVLENIQRHLDMGKEKRKASLEGRMEIGYSAVSITLVDVVVFVPILFLQIFVADMLQQFAVVVVVTVLTSLLVGFTLTPWLSSRIGKKENLKPTHLFNKFLLWFERQLASFIEWYGRRLRWVLNHKMIFTGFVLLLFAGTAIMMKQNIIGKELIATGDQGRFRLALEFDQSVSLAQNDLISQQIEADILKMPRVASLFSNVGGPGTGIGSLGVGSSNKTELTIQLKTDGDALKEAGIKKEPTEEFMRRLREELQTKYAGINFSMMALGLIPRTAPIEITLSGADMQEIMQTATEMKSVIEQIPGADNVKLSVEAGSPELKVIPDKDRMQWLGLSTGYVGMNLRTAFAGNDDATLTEGGTEFPVRIQLSQFNRQDYDDVKNLTMINPAGMPVTVDQFATIENDNAPSLLERKDRQPAITLTADALGRPSGTVADDVVSYVKNNPLPAGIQMTWGSDIKRQDESFGALGSVLLISFILIYLIMVALYDSYIYPFVALFAIPVAAIGAFLALNLSMSHLSLFALLGLIMLMGLVTKNSILIVDFTNQLKAQEVPYKQAIIEASMGRMRPILMTTISMAIGMLPIALGTGNAAAWKNGLAWVIIGGLLSSLALTIFLVPMVYDVVDTLQETIKKKYERFRSRSALRSAAN